METRLALLACVASTLYMTGAIAVVQFVHYPLFNRIDISSFRRYHAEHSRRITPLVFGPMAIELVTSGWLVGHRPPGSSAWLVWTGLAASTTTWVITAIVAVPLHHRLAGGFDSAAHRSLVHTNALRAVAWLVHSVVVLVMVERAIRAV